MSMDTFEGASLTCTCTLETLDSAGAVLRRTVARKGVLTLGRNEFGDVVVKVSSPKGIQGSYVLLNYKLHKNFVREGRATISLGTQKVQLLISNSPPEHLSIFLKHLTVKVLARGVSQGSKQHISGSPSSHFTKISPVSAKDLSRARQANQENMAVTPKRDTSLCRKPAKRKFGEIQPSASAPANFIHGNEPPAKKSLLLGGANSALSEEQTNIVNLVRGGHNVFFTGSAGTGKSFLLRRIIGMLPPDSTYPTASTGAAACVIGGTTLHSFAGIGTGMGSLAQCVSMASRQHKAINWRRCKCLIIDEISMVDGDYFDRLEAVARAVRKSDKPFGGIQLVLCGDFLQLPPVSKDGQKKQYCFKANSWKSCITRSFELTQIYRQNDEQFITALQNIRIGRCPMAITRLLQGTSSQQIEVGGIRATRLYTHKDDVDETNSRELAALAGEVQQYTAIDNHTSYTTQINTLCPAQSVIMLKKGAQVMVVKNIDVSKGLVNGARGIVDDFDKQGLPVIQLTNGRRETIGSEKWTFNMGGGNMLSRKQLPLKLAWAISIHKSQGMTLDCVEISLAKTFERGQAYVALSRAKSLKTVRIKDFSSSCIRADSEVLDFYRSLRQMRRNYIEEVC